MLENSANNGQVMQISPNQLTQQGYAQAQSKAQIAQLLQSNLWYAWNEAEGCFERWSFYTEDSFFVETKAGKKYHKWAFMEHTDLLSLQTETEHPKLVSVFVDPFSIEMYFLGLEENSGLNRRWFVLPNKYLEADILDYSLEKYSKEYENLIQPIRALEISNAKFVKNILFVVAVCLLLILINPKLIAVALFPLGIGANLMFAYILEQSTAEEKRAKAGFVKVYQNPKIKL
jgi:hypothetical protein